MPEKEKEKIQEMWQEVTDILTRRPFAWKYPAALKAAVDQISAEDAELLAAGKIPLRRKLTIEAMIKGHVPAELDEEDASIFQRAALDYASKLIEILALPVVHAGRRSKRSWIKGHVKEYGTRDQRAAFIAALQRVVDRRYEEDPSRSFTKELCQFASDEVPQPWNGEKLKPDTIRHLVKNPKKK
jgi:hypothetical protein